MKGMSKSPHPGLKFVAAQPKECPQAEFDHSLDREMEMHGSHVEPILVEEQRVKKYVQWEYEYILLRILYHKCFQQLLLDEDRKRELDRIVVRDYGGKHHVFYFDITVQKGERNKEMKQAYADYQAGKPVDPADLAAIKQAEKLQGEARKKYPGRG